MIDFTKPTNSLISNMMVANTQPVPEVGMGATIVMWTDRHACTIIEVSKSKRVIKVQYDKATRTDSHGMSDCQSYSYERDTEGQVKTFTLRKHGKYVQKGDSMRGTHLVIGRREEYYDYSF